MRALYLAYNIYLFYLEAQKQLTPVICTIFNLYHLRRITTALLKQFNDGVRSLFLSDDAKYIVAANAILQSLFLKLLHGTCVAYLLHNCTMKVKSQFEDVDQPIAKVISNS